MPKTLLYIRKHNKRVKLTKIICVGLAFLLGVILVFSPLIKPLKQHLLLNLATSKTFTPQLQDKLSVAKAEFYSSSDKGEPFELFAKSVSQNSDGEVLLHNISANLNVNTDQEMILSSESAIWMQQQKFLKLIGNVKIKADNDYEIETLEANLDLKNNFFNGSKQVKIDSKIGKLVANGFSFSKNENILNFNGPIKLSIDR
ncbi:MAG: LPS export ABC transporter periplasmic protein LptC [Alphaproteobacteria bacterium]